MDSALVEFDASEHSSIVMFALPATHSALLADEFRARMQALPVTVTSPTARATIEVGVDRKSFANSSGSVRVTMTSTALVLPTSDPLVGGMLTATVTSPPSGKP